jgi:uncharacterized peroxidase-related enzyme
MPHIGLEEGVPGIRSAMAFRPETAEPLCRLAETLMRGENTLTRGERELIATYVSSLNECRYCATAHGSHAAAQLEGGPDLVESVKNDPSSAPISPKLRSLLAIAARVQAGGRNVTTADVEDARSHGATDVEIHDTVLIAAAFCMFNRYVDGLATWTPTDPAVYRAITEQILEHGYAGIPAVISNR